MSGTCLYNTHNRLWALIFVQTVNIEGIQMSLWAQNDAMQPFPENKMSSTCAVDWKPEPHQQNAPSSLITLGRYNDFESSVGPWAGWGVSASICGPFSAVRLQMRAKVLQKDPPSQACSIMNSLRPTALHMLNFWLRNHISANLLPRWYSVHPRTPHPPWGQGLGSSLPLQTKSLMARNNWDAFHKSCRFANCMHFHLFGQNSWEQHRALHFMWAC